MEPPDEQSLLATSSLDPRPTRAGNISRRYCRSKRIVLFLSSHSKAIAGVHSTNTMWKYRAPTLAASFLSIVLMTMACSPHLKGPPLNRIQAPYGVTMGEVSADSAVVWSKANRTGQMNVKVTAENDRWDTRRDSVRLSSNDDLTGKLKITGLHPDTRYQVDVWFTDQRGRQASEVLESQFRTAPGAEINTSVTFAWGGDLAGQNVCRDVDLGFPIFQQMNPERLDFFIGVGDMIYADGLCEAKGRYGNAQIPGDFIRSADMKNFWAHWRYNREDRTFNKLLTSVPYYAVWDDHEVVNDFGPLHDTRSTAPYTAGAHLLPLGLRAYLNYNPLLPPPETPNRLYRNVRWNKHLEIYFLDNRQYRDANTAKDEPGFEKTMLGQAQTQWLKEQIGASDATWKIIVSSVPIAIPTGFPSENGRDGWANFDHESGFEAELTAIFEALRDTGSRNVVFITTDVHFAEVFRFTPFNNTPDFQVYEFAVGPLNAGLFPNLDFDDTFNSERLFFYGPLEDVNSYNDAIRWMNYGEITVNQSGDLTGRIINGLGEPVYSLTLAAR